MEDEVVWITGGDHQVTEGDPVAIFDGKARRVVGAKEKERGMKYDFSKPQISLLPMKELEGVVRVLEFGAKKYARGDWAFVPGGAFRYFDAGLRHLAELSDPMCVEDLRKVDLESLLPHIDHAICSLIFARHFIFKRGGNSGE